MFTFVQYVFSVGRVRAVLGPELHTWITFFVELNNFLRIFVRKKEISLLNNIGLLLHSASYIAHDVKYKTFS